MQSKPVFSKVRFKAQTTIQNMIMKINAAYPIKKLVKELYEEFGQSEIMTMRHLMECKRRRLLDYDDEFVYAYVDIFQSRS